MSDGWNADAQPQGLERCPTSRPFWCAHPHCLHCNWDDDTDGDASALVACAVDGSGRRHGVGWLCDACARDPALATWFTETARGRLPSIVFGTAAGEK